MVSLNSAYQLGLFIGLREVLIVDEGFRGCRFKNHDIGNVFASTLRTSGDTAKRTPQFDSEHRIGPSTSWTGYSMKENWFCGQGN